MTFESFAVNINCTYEFCLYESSVKQTFVFKIHKKTYKKTLSRSNMD